MTQAFPVVKTAELNSSLVAFILGADLVLFAPDLLRVHAGTFLLLGLLVLPGGMALKYRLEALKHPPLAWKRALLVLTWIMPITLAPWLVLQVVGH